MRFVFRVRSTLVGTENLNENGPNPFWGEGPKTWSESILCQRFCFGMISTTSLSLSMRGRYIMKLPNGNGHLFFKTRGQTSWSSTVVYFTSEAQAPTYYVEVFLLLFKHCRWMIFEHKHSPVRMRYSSSFYTTCRMTNRRRTDVVGWLPKFHGFNLAPLFY